jgi:xylulokinase
MNLADHRWSDRLVAAAGIPPTILPPLVSSMVPIGNVTDSASRATGLPVGTQVVPGGGDVAALAFGCGVIEEGVLAVTLGTAGRVVLSRNPCLPAQKGYGNSPMLCPTG